MGDTSPLDELSLHIIALLQDDGRISIREMAKRLGVAPATVRARYNQLCDDGTIQIVAAPNPTKLGLNFHALVSARLKPGCLEQAVAILERKPEVAWIGLTLKDFNVVFEVVVKDAQVFGEYKERLLAELPGYIDADVSVIWDVRKFRYTLIPPSPGRLNLSKAGEQTPRIKPPRGASKSMIVSGDAGPAPKKNIKRPPSAQN